MMCNEVAYRSQFCSLEGNKDVSKVTATTGEPIQSYPLALTQLLIQA